MHERTKDAAIARLGALQPRRVSHAWSDNFRRREASWSAVALHRFSPACESTWQRCVHPASSCQQTEGRKVTTLLFAIQPRAPPRKSAGAPAHSKTLPRISINFAAAQPLGLGASQRACRVLLLSNLTLSVHSPLTLNTYPFRRGEARTRSAIQACPALL
jgi:hypothetical protein